MTVTTLVSVKGAPGVTTLACLVAGTWPDGRRVVVVEADPFGGDLAARFQLSSAWGWSSYVTAARRSEDDVPLEPHLQALPGGVEVMVLPTGDRRLLDGSSVAALLRSVHAPGGSPSDPAPSDPAPSDPAPSDTAPSDAAPPDLAPPDLVVDAGRLTSATTRTTPGSGDLTDGLAAAVGVWLERSDRVLVVTRRDAPSVLKVREHADALRARCGDRVGLVVVGRGPHDTAAIADFTGIPVVGAVPHDPAAARMVAGAPGSGRLLSRSLLVASARRLALLAAETPIDGGAPDRTDRTDRTVGTPRGARGLLRRVGRPGSRGRRGGEVPAPDRDPAAGPADDRPSDTALPSQAAMR